MPNSNWIAFRTIVVREIMRFVRIWVQTLTPPVINAVLYFIIFGSLIGSRIGEMGGRSYMEYIVPGVVMMGVIVNSYSNVVSSFFSAKYQHFIEELLVSPVRNSTILLGYVAGGVCRGLMVGALVLCVSLVFTELQVTYWFATLVFTVLTAMLFASLGLINAIYARNFDDISIIPNFVLTPLTYFGGVFYSISLLPPLWQTLSQFNPIFYIINGFRHGVLGTADVGMAQAFVVVGVLVVLAMGTALHLLNRGTRLKS
ncbi:MAG: ABC transporter permease [Granulosicoccaceae bacterium]